MARSIMAVCVVCLLCAHRVPCQQHFDSIIPAATVQNHTSALTPDSNYGSSDNGNSSNSFISGTMPLNAKVFQSNAASYPSYNNDATPSKHQRHKRHGDHATHPPHRPQLTEEYIQRIFKEYGESDGTISMHSFRSILRQLGLFKMIPNQETILDKLRADFSNDTEDGKSDVSCRIDIIFC